MSFLPAWAKAAKDMRLPAYSRNTDGRYEALESAENENARAKELDGGRERRSSGWRRIFKVAGRVVTYGMYFFMVLWMLAMWSGVLRIKIVDLRRYPPYFAHNKPITFQEDHRYDPDAKDSIQLWKQVAFNHALGHLYFQDPERYGLIKSKDDDIFVGWQEYSVALFHQLHCLGIIQQKYYKHEETYPSHADKIPHHTDHCFDYLRQSILCSADMTIEHTNGTGWDVEHQCRDMSEIEAFIKQHNGRAVYARGAKLRD